LNIVIGGDASIAWWAHIGGLIAGAVLVLFMRRPGVPLFDRATGVEPKPQADASGSR
jgi:membrane associated rhomboid family serine protease